jgi:hypothetical protein
VIGFVVNLTGSMESGELSIAPPDCGDLGLWAKMKPRNLSTMNAAAILADLAAGKLALCVLPWVSLMSGGGELATIEEWKRLALTEPEEEKRRAYAGLALVFADKAGCLNSWGKGLEGWNVERSQVVLEWERKAELRLKRADLLETVQLRFGQPASPDIVQVVEGETNLDTLNTWFRCAVTAAKLADVRAALGLNGA